MSLSQGATAHVTVATTPANGFASAIALSISGLPAGATATFSPASLGGASSATTTLAFSVAKTVKMGVYPITIGATGDGVAKTASVLLTVLAPPA